MKKIIKSVILVLIVSLLLLSNKGYSQEKIPIKFSEYGITISIPNRLGDTFYYNKSNKEDFKFIFYSKKGKCYCERYVNKKLYEKGNYENSLDTLKEYTSGHRLNGKHGPIKVKKYFEPLKNGEWTIYKKMGFEMEIYDMGIMKEKVVK